MLDRIPRFYDEESDKFVKNKFKNYRTYPMN